MPDRNGFTLIETLITTLILVTGLAAVAALFAYASQSSGRVRQQTAALALLAGKMEELKAMDDESPPGRHSEYLAVAPDGVPAPQDARQAIYLRTWEITPETPRRITVIIYGRRPGRDRPDHELARSTTQAAQGF